MINIIAAIGKNNELGKNNDLIWHLPNDLKFFKETTINKTIIMGLNTFISLGRVLPNRKHIVLAFDDVTLPEGVLLFKNKEDVLNYIKDEDVFVIGGASIYNLFINDADKLYITEISASSDADVYFPNFNKNEFEKTILSSNSDDGIYYDHVLYERK